MTELVTNTSGPGGFNPVSPPSFPVVGRGGGVYNEEYLRLASFNTMLPLEGSHPVLMARAGLYYTGSADTVHCFSCLAVLSNWRSQAIDPVQLHRQTQPECAHLREQDSTNISIVAPDAAATARIKDLLRQRCAELDQNPTQVYYDITRSFSEIGGVSRGEMFGATPGDLESSGPPGLQTLVSPEASLGAGDGDNLAEGGSDRSRLSNTPGTDFELCKNSITERLKTFEHWPLAAQVHPQTLAEAGFVYTGPQDRVQCVHCEGSLRNWQEGDVPCEEHARHFPACPMIRGEQMTAPAAPAADETAGAGAGASSAVFVDHSRNTPPRLLLNSNNLCGVNVTVDASTRELLGVTTDRPKHPHMALEADRIGSFTSWPTGRSQTPQQLAHAGFFYAGFNDSVKCFFCDGGLRNWERDDDPWHEHARWFPRCNYVRDTKGQRFVQDVIAEEHGSVQQTATYQDTGRNSPAVEGERRSRSSSSGREPSERRQQQGIEPREVMARMDTPMVLAVLNMDIPQELVKRAIEHRLRSTGDDFPSMEALLETVFELSAGMQGPPRHSASREASPVSTGSPSRRPGSGEVPFVIEAPRSLVEENRQLKEQRTCKICMDEEVCVVFVPCGHLVCCGTCAPPLSKCPICRSTIRGTVRTYMS